MADTQSKDKNMETSFANQDIQQTNTYGGTGGVSYVTSSGSYITSLQCYSNGTWLSQITVTYDNGSSVILGTATGTSTTLDLTNDSIARLYVSVISNSTAFASGTGVGGIYVETMRGTKYCTLTSSTPLTNPKAWALVSSGSPAQTCQNIVLTGIAGKSGSSIDAISFYFKNDMLMSQGMTDLAYSQWAINPPVPFNVASAVVSNQTDSAQTMSINFQESTSSTLNFSAGAGVTVGESVEVDGGVPLVAEGKVTESAEVSFTITFGVSATFSKTFSYNATLSVQPGETIQANAVASSYTINGSYSAVFAELWAHAGAITRNVSGSVNGVSAYEVNVSYTTNAET